MIRANHGVLFLDEIDSLDLDAQAILLSVLKENKILSLIGGNPITTKFQLIATANQELTKMVINGQFRDDLFQFISSITYTIPSFKERKEVVLALIKSTLEEFAHML